MNELKSDITLNDRHKIEPHRENVNFFFKRSERSLSSIKKKTNCLYCGVAIKIGLLILEKKTQKERKIL
jgi:hypothetical protein